MPSRGIQLKRNKREKTRNKVSCKYKTARATKEKKETSAARGEGREPA